MSSAVTYTALRYHCMERITRNGNELYVMKTLISRNPGTNLDENIEKGKRILEEMGYQNVRFISKFRRTIVWIE